MSKRRQPAPERLAALIALLGLAWGLGLAAPRPARAQGPAQPDAGAGAEAREGRFFRIAPPFGDDELRRLRGAVQGYINGAAARGSEPILVFEILPPEPGGDAMSPGAATELADYLSTELGGAGQTVAFVPKPLAGYGVLAALACREIVLGPEATLGPITPEGQPVKETVRAAVETLARRAGREADLLLGLLDPEADLREVHTADRQVHYVLASRLDAFKQKHTVVDDAPAWEPGRRGILTPERARGVLAKLLAPDRATVKSVYRLPTAADDATLGGKVEAVLIVIDGPVNASKESYLVRRIGEEVRDRGVNLIFFQINSEGGTRDAVDRVARTIADLRDVKTVAFLDDRALNYSALLPLACDEIVFRRGAKLGDVSRVVTGPGQSEPIDADARKVFADAAAELARRKGHPEALARGLVDPDLVVVLARDAKTNAEVFVAEEEALADPNRYGVVRTIKPAGAPLVVTAEEAPRLELARKVVGSKRELLADYGLEQTREDRPTWVDELVRFLNTQEVSYLLLFVGLFMLILELKLPGVGLPALASALAFLLFFWGHYLGGTADKLEILLFLVGLVCLALELFVFPGFGVFGVSGVLLVLFSVVMASHTFVWPTQEYEYRQMGRTLMQVTATIVGVAVGAVVVGRYLPSLPLFRHMILTPEPPGGPEDELGKPLPDPDAPLSFLLGEVGRTTTVLRPSGKARFGEYLVDATAESFYIEADSPIEVVDVRGARVIVKKM